MDGRVDAGETLTYRVVLYNDGDQGAVGLRFIDTPGTNTTLMPGSVTTSRGTITEGNEAGDTRVEIDLGSMAAGGGAVLITYHVQIDDPLPAGITEVANQGRITGDNLDEILTDDPDTPTPSDATVTEIDPSGRTATEDAGELPTRFELGPTYPNPFKHETVIPFGVPHRADVSMRVYDVLGREVATLLDRRVALGWHTVTWQAAGLSAGLYVVRLESEAITRTWRLTLMK